MLRTEAGAEQGRPKLAIGSKLSEERSQRLSFLGSRVSEAPLIACSGCSSLEQSVAASVRCH